MDSSRSATVLRASWWWRTWRGRRSFSVWSVPKAVGPLQVVLVGSDGAVCRVETCLGRNEIARLLGGAVFSPPGGVAAPASTVYVTELMERYLEFKVSLSRAPKGGPCATIGSIFVIMFGRMPSAVCRWLR